MVEPIAAHAFVAGVGLRKDAHALVGDGDPVDREDHRCRAHVDGIRPAESLLGFPHFPICNDHCLFETGSDEVDFVGTAREQLERL